jgi:hypothetical protein
MTENIDPRQVLADLSDNLPAAIFIYRIDKEGNDRVQYISEGCLSIWGVAAEEVVENATKLWELILPVDLE